MTAIKPTTISELLQPLRDAQDQARQAQFEMEKEALAHHLLRLLPGVPFELRNHEKHAGHPIAIVSDGEDEEGNERIYRFTVEAATVEMEDFELVLIFRCFKCNTQSTSYPIYGLDDLLGAIERRYPTHYCAGTSAPAEELANAIRNVIGQE